MKPNLEGKQLSMAVYDRGERRHWSKWHTDNAKRHRTPRRRVEWVNESMVSESAWAAVAASLRPTEPREVWSGREPLDAALLDRKWAFIYGLPIPTEKDV